MSTLFCIFPMTFTYCNESEENSISFALSCTIKLKQRKEMYSKKQFLVKFRMMENELLENYEFSKLKSDKETMKLILRYIREVREIQAMIRADIEN